MRCRASTPVGPVRQAPTGPRPAPRRRFVLAVTLLAGLSMVVAGVWALLWPSSFADAVDFGRHTHFVHDAGAFQIGIGCSCCWRWPGVTGWRWPGRPGGRQHRPCGQPRPRPDMGGHAWDSWGLAALSLLTGAALVVRLRQLGWVVGEVGIAASPLLARSYARRPSC
jgi:hypothetical protein